MTEEAKKTSQQAKPQTVKTDGEKIAETNKQATGYVLTDKGWELK